MEDGNWARNNEQKAKAFAEYLELIFRPHEVQTDDGENEEGLDIEMQRLEEIGNEKIRLVTPKEMAEEIFKNLNPKEAPGFDLITGEVLKQLPRKGILKMINLMNATFRLKYVPKLWKIAEVIMIPKPGKSPNEIKSYRPISLLPIMSKLFQKLVLKRIKPIIDKTEIIPTHQFGYRDGHSTIDQVHRITDVIEKALEEKRICTAIFLDVAQAFDKVWHEGLIYKLRRILPEKYCLLLEFYIKGRYFRIKREETYSDLKEIRAGVPQGSVLGPMLYLLYTKDVPKIKNTTMATFADDTAILSVAENIEETTKSLHNAVNKISRCTRR